MQTERRSEVASGLFSAPPVKDRFVAITGPAGIGKTALAREFSRKVAERTHWINLLGLTPANSAQYFIALEADRHDLIIADGLDAGPEAAAPFLERLGRSRGEAMTIVTSRSLRFRGESIELGPLPASAVQDIWQSNLVNLDYSSSTTAELLGRVGGHPVVATLVGRLIRDGMVDIAVAARNLGPFASPGLLGPDGRPLPLRDERRVEADIRVVDANLLDRLDRQPELLYQLSSRQFEELVAHSLEMMGYEIELTPATRDGGKDIYAARKDALGSFLYIVECKRYAPGNRVGVGIVRSLSGVVNAERANGGIVATTSFFTRDAREFQQQVSYQLTLQDYFGVQELVRSARQSRGARLTNHCPRGIRLNDLKKGPN